MELTLGAALLAGLISFLSPCVLPVVPAYLGQLGIAATRNSLPASTPDLMPIGAAAVATAAGGGGPTAMSTSATMMSPTRAGNWRAMPNAFAFVLGFTLVFTVLGVTAYVVAGPLRENLPLLRQVGGVVLIVLGLNLMGVLRLSRLSRSWKPLERFGSAQPGAKRGGVIGGFALGSVFAIGWTPCIGPTLAAILTMAAVSGSPQVIGLLLAYSIGLGIPFLLMALAIDRAPLVTRPILRYSRQIEIVGGGLIVFLGFALIFDWLGMFARTFNFLWPVV
jgi:cytochrome c-type biogenesis protein